MKECKVLYKTVVDPMTCIKYTGEVSEALQIYNMMMNLNTTSEAETQLPDEVVNIYPLIIKDYRGKIHEIHIGDYVVDEGIYGINVFREKEFYNRFKIIS